MSDAINLRKLPPLKALKGFETAARLQSVRGAAEELNLTHPAITHQIQSLEDNLGTKLFARDGRNVILTTEGKLFYPYVREALEKLINGTEAVRRATTSQPLRIQVYVTTSIRWLAPRLSQFRAEHPNIKLHLMTCSAGWEFDEADADIGLIYRDKPVQPHLHWTKLFDSKLFPVCSPSLIEKKESKLQPKDLLNFPLIMVYTEGWSWDDWFSATNASPNEITNSIIVDTLAIALEMALRGEGIALVNGVSADDDLKSGRLIQPIDYMVDGLGEWGVVCRKDICNDERVITFIDWLSREAAKS
ncbi:LysR substrate-binding domain-containing protein [Neptunomonas japonica]|uniref:LysR family transcriptional regulator, glycine cleavage system transcriptional activator n=1 Tax=Neptunomonas japonica JAMM 1380 TaxID=1441457 RepID=A0A7R6PUJ3_9GAMM|nr:LysR substrate-binding domain-containing protein [Neptunomonas japonica]BBB29758.1 LysR family transcriptional regulator, glycine cleavage system transcriptional activator [Neptunomonas japonica JAMM 1380]